MSIIESGRPLSENSLRVALSPRQEHSAKGRAASALRIVHLGKFFHPAHGGIERAVRSLAHAQAELGCQVQVICMDHERSRTTRFDRDGPIEIIRLRRSLSFGKIDFCPDLGRAIRDSGADLIHLHTPNPSMIFGLMCSGDRTPLAVSHHSDIVKQKLRRIAFGLMERACYDRAALVLAMSPTYVDGSAPLQRCREKVGVLPIGLNLDPILNPSRDVLARSVALKQTVAGPIWFSCGRLVYYKGLETALRALQSVPGTLLIAGAGPHRRRLERTVIRLKLDRRVRFLGRIDSDEELIAHYLAADAFWFPSNARSEAFGLVQVEAMAAACPVINAAIPGSGVPWVSRHEESGLTVPINDSAAFAAAAMRLLDEPGLRARLAAGAQNRAVAEFGQMEMGRRSLVFYQDSLRRLRSDHHQLQSV